MSELNVYALMHEYLHLAGLYKFYIYYNDFRRVLYRQDRAVGILLNDNTVRRESCGVR